MLRRMWTFGERSDLAPVYAVVLAAGKRTRLRPLTDDKDTSAYPRLPVSDECSDLSEPRSEQAGVERTA